MKNPYIPQPIDSFRLPTWEDYERPERSHPKQNSNVVGHFQGEA